MQNSKLTFKGNLSLRIMFLGVILLLSSCGSGSGNSDGPIYPNLSLNPVSYNGKTTQAVITAQNALDLFLSAWNGGPSTASSSSPQPINSSNIISPQLILNANTFAKGSIEFSINSVIDNRTEIQNTYHGRVSGTVTYSGYRNDDGTGEVTVIYDNFNDGDGTTYHGRSIITTLSYDHVYNEPTEVNINMAALTFQTSTLHYTLTGTMHETIDPYTMTEILACNFDGRNEASMDTFRLENFIIEKVCDDLFSPTYCTDGATGRLYLASEGYVDIHQVNPFEYNYYGRFNEDRPDTGGPLLIYGDNGSKTKVIPLSVEKFQVMVDSDGDNTFETINEYHWSQFTDFIITWKKTYGTPAHDSARSIQKTSDGGYIIAGTTQNGLNNNDFYLIKITSLGDIEWEKIFGASIHDLARSVKESPDGGYIITGYSEVSPSVFSKHIYIVKTDSEGNLEWEKRFDTIYHESTSYDVLVTSDNNYIIVGPVRPVGRSPYTSSASYLYLIKLDLSGDIIWDKKYAANAIGYSVQETSDGGYIAAGNIDRRDRNGKDIYLIKTDQDGNLLWERSFGDTTQDSANKVRELADGGYIISGYMGKDNTYLQITDAEGSTLWEKTLWHSDRSYWNNSVHVTPDGGFIISGKEDRNIFLMKRDANGNPQWERSFNWSGYFRESSAFDIQITSDGGYIVAGHTDTSDEMKNIYIIKTDSEGNIFKGQY